MVVFLHKKKKYEAEWQINFINGVLNILPKDEHGAKM